MTFISGFFPLKMRYCGIIGRRNWDVRWARCLLARTFFSKWQILSSSTFIRSEVSQYVLKKMNTNISTRIQGHQSMNVAGSHDPLDFLRNATSRPNFLTYAGGIGAEIHGWQRVYSEVDVFYSYWIGFCENSKYSPNISNILVKWNLCDAT